MSAQARALEILNRVESEGAYASILLSALSRRSAVDPRDVALTQRIVKGVTENRSSLDLLLDPLLPKGITSLTTPIANCLRVAAYQIYHLTRVPPEVAVNESVTLAKTASRNPTHPKLVNAVLRRLVERRRTAAPLESDPTTIQQIADRYSHPLWLVERWAAQFGLDEALAICRSNNEIWPLTIRINSLRTAPDEIRRRLENRGVITAPGQALPECLVLKHRPVGLKIHELEAFKEGLFIIQDEAAALISHLVNPLPGQCLVDLCSAPGGKCTHLAALMGDKGRITAVDVNERRLHLVRENCRRLGVHSVSLVLSDARDFAIEPGQDAVLLDAPCSGSGVIGRKTEIRWNKKENNLLELHRLQRELLDHAALLVKPGGRLVYSTCSIDRLENEEVTSGFLASHSTFKLIPADTVVRREYCTPDGYLRTWPHRHQMAGGFAAILARQV